MKETDPRGGMVLGGNDCMWVLLAKRPTFALTLTLDTFFGNFLVSF